MRAIYLSCLAAIMLAYPDAARAQAEQGSSAAASPASASVQQRGASAGDGAWWERLEFGIKGGLNQSTFVGGDSTSDEVEYIRKSGLTIGGAINIRLFRWLALQPEVLFVSKGRDVEFDGEVTNTFEVQYIEVPLLARVTIPLSQRVNPYLIAGVTFGKLLSFKVKDAEDGTITDRTDQAKSIDPGWLGGVGVHVALSRQHALLIEGRYNQSLGTISKDETEDLENSVFAFMAGYQYSLSSEGSVLVSDRDGDGIPDGDDECPKEAEDQDTYQVEDGCPEPDNDGDRILDAADKCPDDAEDVDGYEDKDGCSEPDNDSDGKLDAADKCPDEAEDPDEFQQEDGCPEPDNDDDGVLDGEDACPNENAGATGVSGCPDRDRDGIADRDDYCPNTAGTPERQGCMRVRLSQDKLEIEGQVSFQGNGRILRGSHSLLDEVAELLQEHSANEALRLRITVYAATKDAAAQTRANTKKKEQAQVRAEAVRSYLEDKGVSSSRIEVAGDLESRRKPPFSIDFAVVQ